MGRALKVSVFIEAIAQTKGIQAFNQELRRCEAAAKKLGPALDFTKNVGAGVGLAFTAAGAAAYTLGSRSLALASDIQDMANSANVSTDAIQVMGYTATLNGAKVQDLATATAKLQAAAVDAAGGNAILTASFAKLGIDAAAFARLTPERQMERFGRAIASAANQQEALAYASDILGGKQAPKLLAALKALGTEGYDALAAKATAAGQVMAADMVANLDTAADRIALFQNRLTILGGTLADTALLIEKNGVSFRGATIGGTEISRALEKADHAMREYGAGTYLAAEAQVELAEAQLRAGNSGLARAALRAAEVPRVLGNKLLSGEDKETLASNAARVRAAIAAQVVAEEKKTAAASVQTAEDAEEKRVALAATSASARAKIEAELYKKNAEAAQKYKEDAAKRAADRDEEIYKENEARAERHNRALNAILNAGTNEYAKRGLQLGDAPRAFGSVPPPQTVAPIAFTPPPPTFFTPNNAGREDRTTGLLSEIKNVLTDISRKPTGLA
jgi:hypothetical protein